MSKYTPLGEFLRKQRASRVPMSFEEIERVTGIKLPPKAQLHRAWWSNNPLNNVMTKVWLEAGYETEQVDMAERKLVFRRSSTAREKDMSSVAKDESGGQHPLIGALKGLVKVMPGTDLTRPADPDWGKANQ